mmetsp:Transcript_34043/g.89514  ORF Transcript_34043/g.89514 Transcript_34043/m.89514 type:complete len:370 (+) Transcript_34043:82-1191(+)
MTDGAIMLAPPLRVVRHQLEVAPTANMWMHLGDLTSEAAHYQKAWDVSKSQCARAKLKLGSASMKEEKWEEARAHLADALSAKGHYAEAWYCCAVCWLKLDETEKAMADLRKVIALDPSHYQAWSSLGGLFAKAKMKREALYAFRQACKLRSDNWQLWQHAALAALDVGLFEEAIFNASRVTSLNGPPAPQISSLVSQAVAKDIKGTDGRYARRLLPKARDLLQNACKVEPTTHLHWESRLHLEKECGSAADVRTCLAAQLQAYREHSKWTKDSATLDITSEVAAQLVEAKLATGDAKEYRECKTIVDEVKTAPSLHHPMTGPSFDLTTDYAFATQMLHAAGEHLAASPGFESLRMLHASVVRHLDDDD